MLTIVTNGSEAVVAAPANQTAQIVRGTILLIVFLAIVGWVGFRSLRRSEDPARLVFKWIMTAGVFWVIATKVMPMIAQGGYGAAFGGVPFAAVCGLALAIIWRHNLSEMFAKPFTSLYDGGDTEPEPEPFYSPALAKRKRGHYMEAIKDVHGQLERFPNDFKGQYMIAEIQAENLNDLPSAEITVQRICNQKSQTPGCVAMALNSMADWQLKYSQDRDAAREALERIIELLPESEFAAMAAQRIAHLAETEHLLAHHDPRRIVVKAGVQDMGLIAGNQQPKAPEIDPARQAADYVKHLEAHPLDTEAREKLAVLYANHYGRTDLAGEQLEQLISHPGQPANRIVHWLNLLADLQVQHGANYESARATLQRIADLYPNIAAAGVARSRIAHLKLEIKGKEKSQAVKLGSYEQDIGLKRET